jgi:predicted RNase H-like HicB family nuclease
MTVTPKLSGVKVVDFGYNDSKVLATAKVSNDMVFHVSLEESEDGWIVAECPALPGCVSQGKDEKEALENIREAIIAWLWAEDQKAAAAMPKNNDRSPVVVTV